MGALLGSVARLLAVKSLLGEGSERENETWDWRIRSSRYDLMDRPPASETPLVGHPHSW